MSLEGYEFAVLWFTLMIFTIVGAEWLGGRISRTKGETIQYDAKSKIWYYMVSALAAAGLAFSVAQVVRGAGFNFILQSLNRGAGNNIHDALYAHYSVGIGSLRYLTIPASGAAVFLLFSGDKNYPLHIANVGLMVVAALISSRLSLIASGVVFLVLQARSGRSLPLRTIVITIIAGALLLTVANATRNKNYYADRGITNPYIASISEGLTYLGSPFQGTLSAMEAVATGEYQASNGIDPNLTTNSAVEDLVTKFKPWMTYGLFPIIVGVSAMAYVLAYKTTSLAFVAGAGAWGYAFCEIWRVMLFGQGIFWVLLIFGLLVPCAIEIGYPRPKVQQTSSVAKRLASSNVRGPLPHGPRAGEPQSAVSE